MKENKVTKITSKESRDKKGNEVQYFYNKNNLLIAIYRDDELITFDDVITKEELEEIEASL